MVKCHIFTVCNSSLFTTKIRRMVLTEIGSRSQVRKFKLIFMTVIIQCLFIECDVVWNSMSCYDVISYGVIPINYKSVYRLVTFLIDFFFKTDFKYKIFFFFYFFRMKPFLFSNEAFSVPSECQPV